MSATIRHMDSDQEKATECVVYQKRQITILGHSILYCSSLFYCKKIRVTVTKNMEDSKTGTIATCNEHQPQNNSQYN